MADKIKKSYKFSKHFYDDAITQGKWWSRLYFNLLWGGVDDNCSRWHSRVYHSEIPTHETSRHYLS